MGLGENLANQRKHGISFDEAIRVFEDPLLVSELDRIEGGEQRWRTFGSLGLFTIVVVAHTLRDDRGDEHIRVISARYVEPKERRRYEEQNG